MSFVRLTAPLRHNLGKGKLLLILGFVLVIYSIIHSRLYLSIDSFICLFIYSFIFLFVYSFIYLSIMVCRLVYCDITYFPFFLFFSPILFFLLPSFFHLSRFVSLRPLFFSLYLISLCFFFSWPRVQFSLHVLLQFLSQIIPFSLPLLRI